MPRTPLLNLRVDDETKARWETASRDAGISLAEFVRETVNAAIEDAAAEDRRNLKKKPAKTAKAKAALATGATVDEKRAGRTGMCEHRIPPSAFCPRCDA